MLVELVQVLVELAEVLVQLAVVLLRWVGQILMNFTVGFVSALVAFLFSLDKVLWAYKTGLLSGALFFFIAATGASAMVALVVGGMYTTAVGGVPRPSAPRAPSSWPRLSVS